MESKLIYQCEEKIILRFTEKKIELPEELKEKIKHYWEKKIEVNPRLENGIVYTIVKIESTDSGEIIIWVSETSYAHYLYSKEYSLPKQSICRSIAANTMLITKDQYIVLGKMNSHTSMPNIIKFIGGAFSYIDIKNKIFDVNHCIEREVVEELGISLEKIKVEKKACEYILTRQNFSFMNRLKITEVEWTKNECIAFFNQSKNNKEMEQELSNIVFVKNQSDAINEFMKKNNDSLIDYMREFFLVYNKIKTPRNMIKTLE